MTSVGRAVDPARGEMLRHALAFVMGFAIIFIVLGASVGLVGFALRDNIVWLARVAGIGLVVMGMHLTGLITVPLLARTVQWELGGRALPATAPRVGLRRSFFVGSAFSIGWTPCVGPILAAILTLAATTGSVVQGTLLLTAYSLGMAIPFLIAAIAFSRVTAGLRRIGSALPAIEVISGLLLIFMGMLIFLDRTTVLNDYFTFLPASLEDVSATDAGVSGVLGFAVAFFAGIVSIVSPCMLPMIPVYLGHLAGVSGTAESHAARPMAAAASD